jgi:hypothetical protein
MIHRTLDAVMNRKIIASAPERARRADWKIVEKNAADFAARGFDSEPETMLRLVWAIASGIGGTADIAHLGGHVAV